MCMGECTCARVVSTCMCSSGRYKRQKCNSQGAWTTKKRWKIKKENRSKEGRRGEGKREELNPTVILDMALNYSPGQRKQTLTGFVISRCFYFMPR